MQFQRLPGNFFKKKTDLGPGEGSYIKKPSFAQAPNQSPDLPQRDCSPQKKPKKRREQGFERDAPLSYSLYQCSARAAQDIEGHHRPVIASIFHPLGTRIVPLRSWFSSSVPPPVIHPLKL